MRYRTIVAAFPDRFSPEPVVRILASQVLTLAAGPTVYDAVDYFERALFGGGPGTRPAASHGAFRSEGSQACTTATAWGTYRR